MEGNSAAEKFSVRFGGEGVEEDAETLKKRISGHPLYGLLTETHLDCLKVCLGDIEEVDINALNQADTELNATIPKSSDLDNFMEEYCMALGKLKEAMEKPVQETASFINSMYNQLNELSVAQEPTSPLQYIEKSKALEGMP